MKPKISFPRLYFFIVESIQDFTFLYLNSPEGFFSFKLKIHASWNFFKVILVLPVLKSPSVATGDIEWKMLRIGLFLVFSKCIFHVHCEPDVCFEFSIRTVYYKESILKRFKTTKVPIIVQVEPFYVTRVRVWRRFARMSSLHWASGLQTLHTKNGSIKYLETW